MRALEQDTFTNKDISSAVSIGAYTADAARAVLVTALVNQVAGNGDYGVYLTITRGAVEYRLIPQTLATAAAGLTSIGFLSGLVPLRSGDILTIYIDGLAGDTVTPDTIVDFYEFDYGAVFPAGAVTFTYHVYESSDGVTPIDDVEVWISTDNPADGNPTNVVWSGVTDALGVARDVHNNLPKLDAGTYFFWRSKSGYSFTDPDTETVS